MKYTIHKEHRVKDNWWVYSIRDEKGSLHTIKAISDKGYATNRKTMANVLWMLRKTRFIATELSGIQKLPPLDFFEQLKADSLKLYAITYDDIDMLSKSDKPFDIYGLSTNSSFYFGTFFFRIYNKDYYKKVLDILLPLIDESGIICKQKSFIIFGDARNQY